MSENRRCQGCGGAMPKRMHRQRDNKGQLVCDSCKGFGFGEWNVTYANKALPEHLVEEFERREAQAITALLRVEAGLQVVAHDSGDGETIYHCPFCGSGQVTGGHNGTVSCDFCHTNFTVQVQPEFQAMPQTVDGIPYNIPGMPGGGPDAGAAAPAAQDQQTDVQQGQPEEPPAPQIAPGVAASLHQAGVPASVLDGHKAEPEWDTSTAHDLCLTCDWPVSKKGDHWEHDPKNPTQWSDKRTSSATALLMVAGVALPVSKAVQHLALRYADDREMVLAQVRTENQS